MKPFLWKLLIVTAIAVSVGITLSVSADDTEVSGEILSVDRNSSTIEIEQYDEDPITIKGFPFNNLEAQLDDALEDLYPEGITIETADCVAVKYSVKELSSGEIINKWESLTMFDKECHSCDVEVGCECDDRDYCNTEGLTRNPIRHRPRHKPKPGHGKPSPPGPKGN